MSTASGPDRRVLRASSVAEWPWTVYLTFPSQHLTVMRWVSDRASLRLSWALVS